jgi:hypothetical protein
LKYLEALLDSFQELGAIAFLKMGDYGVKDDRDGVEGVGCVVPPLKGVRIL